MDAIVNAFLEYLAFGVGYMIFATILTAIMPSLGQLSTYLVPIGFIVIPFIGNQPWWAYILAFLLVFIVSFVIIEGFRYFSRKK